ncbi:hypothetical protein E2P81_ATG07329 [Venturia nashicola]|nr:hypothetical protein E2P81_ATG07329 [Venturia nashicola]
MKFIVISTLFLASSAIEVAPWTQCIKTSTVGTSRNGYCAVMKANGTPTTNQQECFKVSNNPKVPFTLWDLGLQLILGVI